MQKIQTVCLFCGGANEVAQEYLDLATEFGSCLNKIGVDLIYGGGNNGLMGKASTAAVENGVKVSGIFPIFLEKYEGLNKNTGETQFVNTMFERKEILLKRGDIFVVLPGGFGTLDEFFEVLTLKILSQLDGKPIIVLNYQGYWDELLNLCAKIISYKFSYINFKDYVHIATDLSEVIDFLNKEREGHNAL